MSEAKSSKSGRNKAFCAAYKLSNHATFNKACAIHTHLRRYGSADTTATSALALCIKSDSLTSKALKGASLSLSVPTIIKREAYHAKRYRKAQRQLAKAEHDLKLAEDAKDNKAAALASLACLKAQRYVQHYHP